MDFLKLGKILAGEYYAVPDYQRDYEWTGSQTITLLDDLIEVAKDKSATTHFFGAIVTIPFEDWAGMSKSIDFEEYSIDPSANVKHVVDGQQRLTTFSLLICALKNVIIADCTIDSKFKQNFAEKQLEGLLFGNDFNQDGWPAPILVLNGNTGACYNKEILKVSDQSYSGIYKGAKRMKAAYDLFEKELQNYCEEFKEDGIVRTNEEFYKLVINALKQKIIFVEIECDASSDAFQVFDSLNGKGLDLTAADRIKNIFMSWCPKGKGWQQWDSLTADVGEDYLSSFFVAKFFYEKRKRISKNKLPDTFKEVYKSDAVSHYSTFYNNLVQEGQLYGQLRTASTGYEKLDVLLDDFRKIGMDQVYVIIFAAALNYGKTALTTKAFIDFIKALQTMMVRMQVGDRATNRLDAKFADYIKEMRINGATLAELEDKIKSDTRILVSDGEFIASFKHFAPADNKVAEFYLRYLENELRRKKGNRTKVQTDLTVEHIIPQTLHELSDWYGQDAVPEELEQDFKAQVCENIGNKLLLYGDDNSAASNNNYTEKVDIYKNGKRGQNQGTPLATFELVVELINDYQLKFNHEEVERRASWMAKEALNIWSV